MALLPTLPTTPSLTRRQLLQSGSALGLATTLPGLHAQANWPTKSIRFVVPFAPGGSSEIVARSTAAELSKSLGQSVYVENKPGAAGNIAMQEVARADDQHTVVLGHIGTLAVNPYIFPKLPYDPNKDFQPVSLLAKVPSLYVVHPDVPAKNLKEFVAYVRANPGKFSYGSAGNGSAGHLAFEYLKMTANLFMLHVPYKGTGPMMTDLLSGRLDAASVGASALLPFIKSGKVRALAVTSADRNPLLPGVPTLAESGVPGVDLLTWIGFVVPAGTPQPVIAKLHLELAGILQMPQTRELLSGMGMTVVAGTPEQFAQAIQGDAQKFGRIIRAAGIRLD